LHSLLQMDRLIYHSLVEQLVKLKHLMDLI
jgi:hypothetical protein